MPRAVILLVDYGTNNSIHIALFKEKLKQAGWEPGFLEGVFEKKFDLSDARIETEVQEEFDSAANHAAFKKTYCEMLVADEELRFLWDWNTP